MVDFTYRGLPGDLVFQGAVYGPVSDGAFFSVLAGPTYLFSNGSFDAEFVGIVDGNGMLTQSVDTTGFLPPGMQHVSIVVQPIHFLAGNGFVVSDPRSFDVLAPGL